MIGSAMGEVLGIHSMQVCMSSIPMHIQSTMVLRSSIKTIKLRREFSNSTR